MWAACPSTGVHSERRSKHDPNNLVNWRWHHSFGSVRPVLVCLEDGQQKTMNAVGFKLIDDRHGEIWCVCGQDDYREHGPELYRRQDVMCGVSDELDEAITDFHMNLCLMYNQAFQVNLVEIL